MHMLDMYTREKAHKLHLNKMRRERLYGSLLRDRNLARNLVISKRIGLMLIFVALALLLSAFLIPSINSF